MADRLTSEELDKMQKSVSETTDLSRKLRGEFSKIKNVTDVLSQNFKQIVIDAQNNQNIAEKYLISQKASEAIAEKIHEIKSKSSYLDSVGLEFKREEVKLQAAIIAAQIRSLQSSVSMANINKADREKAIEKLKIQNVLHEAELQYFEQNASANSNLVGQLERQKQQTDDIVNNIILMRGGMIDTSTVANTLKGSFNLLSGKSGLIVKDLGNLGKLFEESISPGTILAKVIETGYTNFKAFDKAATSLRSTLGALPNQAANLESLIKQVTIESMHLGATFEDTATSISSIAKEFTSLVADDKDLLRTTVALSKQFGVSQDISVKFLKTLGGISDTSTSSQRSMTGFAQKLAQAAGIPLGKLMEDVANASDETRLYIGSSAVSLIKAAAAARSLGIDLNKAAASANKLLDFETSITSELKASALLGENVNFNYARQLAFNKNIIGANQEILKIAKQVRFNQLNPIQQKAFADAAGKTVSELQDMFTQEKNMQLVANSTNKQVRERYAEYQKLMRLKEDDAKNEAKTAEEEFLRRANQEKLNQLQNQFNQLMSELAVPVMEITNQFLKIANFVFPLFVKVAAPLLGLTAYISNALKITSILVKNISFAVQKGLSFTNAIKASFTTFSKLPAFFSKFTGIFGVFGKFLGPLGLIINAFTFINSLMKRWDETPKGILGGLEAIGGALYDTILKPFKDAWDWIRSLFIGKSPSELGLGIVKGIKSVGGMLLDVLTAPFRTGYNLISSLFGGSEMKAPSEVLSDISGDAKKAGTEVKSINNDALIQTIQTGNQQLVAKLDQLITMMSNGGISVNLDGQKVSAILARTTYRSGGFGQATINA